MMIRVGSWFCVFSIALMMACIQEDLKKIKFQRWEPEIAIPIIHSSFTVGDILTTASSSRYISVGEDEVVHLHYNGRIFSKTGNQLLHLDNLPFDIDADSLRLQLGVEDFYKLSQVILNKGNLEFDIKAILEHETEVTVTIPNLINEGGAFNQVFDLIPDTEGFVSQVEQVDLTGYVMDLTASEENTFNVMDILTKALDKVTGEEVNLNQIDINAQLNELLFSYVEGFFSELSLGDYIDTIKLDIVKSWKDGSIVLVNPSVEITVSNDFGFPVVATLSSFDGFNGSLETNLLGSVVNSSWINGSAQQAGDTMMTTLAIDTTNSNLVDFLSLTPQNIVYNLNLKGNVETDFSTFNFLTDSSRVNADIDVDVPLAGKINVVLRDTFAIKLDTIGEVRSVAIQIISENGLPHDLEAQVFLLNADRQLLDSLLTDGRLLMQSGITDEEGRVTESSKVILRTSLDNEGLQHLFAARYLVVEGELITSENADKVVVYTSDNYLTLAVSAIVGVSP